MPIDPYAALNAMVRAEVARSSEPHVAATSPGRHEPQQSGAGGEAGDADHGSGEDPRVTHRP
ncbi:hypothetical protein [Streptomyces flavidovirens]|uniref:hypothetical protein n=1 Tax=Streptomyces flavidovirens TaxID=67298 RepID=UPI00048DF2F1|nr:hypothetical protein [Streptomyces flavidovirens]